MLRLHRCSAIKKGNRSEGRGRLVRTGTGNGLLTGGMRQVGKETREAKMRRGVKNEGARTEKVGESGETR